MEISLYQIDAFASKLFEGNPAAVCPLDEWRALKNPIDSRFYDFYQFFRKGAVKLTTN